MSILKNAVLLGALLATGTGQAVAQGNSPASGDTFIISRDNNRLFRGSHKIYDRMSDGLIAVQYCGRDYFVRYATVAWTELEVDHGYAVRVEYNHGKGWRPICNNPEEQVNLKGLGVTEDPRVVVQDDGVIYNRVNRFAAIRDAFRSTGQTASKASFHSTGN